MPIPHDVEASTQNSTGDREGGFTILEPQKERDNCSLHQAMSSMTVEFGVRRENGEELWGKEEVNLEIAGRRERPSGRASEQWTNVPKTDSASLHVKVAPVVQEDNFSM
jgi:hypothetical protein